MTDIYIEKGYKNRIDYLTCLSEEYDVELSNVLALAGVLGPSEDFDGLVTTLQDECDRREF